MCGIVGYVGKRPAVDILIQGLKRLEYRGYDSAGVAFFRGNQIEIRKSEGKLENVEKLLNGSAALFKDATCGIGHTRWATHGKPTTQNAHPHRAGHVVLVHNGIIENYQEIKKELLARGYQPQSETDSELFGFLVLEEMKAGRSLLEAVRKSFTRLEGACSVVVMSENEPGVVIGARNGSPLVAALDPKGGVALASDAQPLLEISRDVYFLEPGDVAVGTAGGVEFFDLKSGKPLTRKTTHLDWSVEKLDKQGYPHYMLKEIFEQPTALVDTFNGLMDRASSDPFVLAAQPAISILEKAQEIVILACGTSYHAALLGKYWIERWANIPVNVELASEFRYRKAVLRDGTAVIGMSQSGETADTLAVIREVKARKVPTIGITNVRGSTLSREADSVLFTFAGPEVGVAATKTFLAQLGVLLVLAGYLSIRRNPGSNETKKALPFYNQILRLPHLLSNLLGGPERSSAWTQVISDAAKAQVNSKGFFFIGRGYSFPIALEGALKLKEIAYVHAEGYAGGELKHGPIAMIDKNMTVVVLAPKDGWREKTVSNLEEVKSRGARIIGVGNSSDRALQALCDHFIPLPDDQVKDLDEGLYPFLLTPVIQLLSYDLAVLKGTDVDQPRNLAKSVTVE